MKRNIIFLLVDCFDYSKIGSSSGRNSPTPFLDSLKGKSYWCERMYSQAPFTEAALIATMCGYDTLDRGGYLMRYKNCPETLFELFQKNGYEVYAQMWSHFDPESALRGIDCLELRPYSFHTLWLYRFEYYSQLLADGKLEEQDYRDLKYILKVNLEYWKSYLELLMSADPSVRIIQENATPFDYEADLRVVSIELDRFHNSPKEYTMDFLKQGKDHILYSLHDNECLDAKVPEDLRLQVAEKHSALNQRIYETNNRLNRKNNHIQPGALLDYFSRSKNALNIRKRTQFSQYLRNYYHITHYRELLGCISEQYQRRKDWLSTEKMMEYFLDWEAGRSESKAPYFAYMHTEDIHGQPTVFDICSTNEDEIARQLQRVNDYIDNLPSNYSGNLGYDLGLLHVDGAIERFVKQLEEREILKNSVLVITSDHGCGTNYSPLRGEIQNFHDECYHVPFILFGAGITPHVDSDYHMTKDIMASLAELEHLDIPSSSTGASVFSTAKRKVVLQEYMGPGCPDMYRRPIWMCAFDNSWKVFIKAALTQDDFSYSLEEIYDLRKDHKELRNLAKSDQAKKRSAYLIDLLRQRWEAIKANYSREGIYEI